MTPWVSDRDCSKKIVDEGAITAWAVKGKSTHASRGKFKAFFLDQS